MGTCQAGWSCPRRQARPAGRLAAARPLRIVAEGRSFILPVAEIRKRLAKAGVRPVTSPTSRYYDAALDDFFAGRYRAALPKFRKAREDRS